MDEVTKELVKIRESQLRMEADLKYHIKRTDILETQVIPVVKAFNGLKWGMGAVIVIASFLTALAKIKVII
jgi:hypothetical protein